MLVICLELEACELIFKMQARWLPPSLYDYEVRYWSEIRVKIYQLSA